MKKLQSGHLEFIKWMAIIFMTLDHLGRIVLNDNTILLAIGRLAFPLFAFLIAHNYIFNTSNKNKYIKRLFLFGIISQPFFMYVFDTNHLNILFTLGFGLLFIRLFEILSNSVKNKIEMFIGIMFLIMFFSLVGFLVDYIHFGIALVISFYLFIKKSKYFIFITIPIIYFMNPSEHFIITISGLFSLFFIYKGFLIKRTNKYFFYFYYPLHLLALKLFLLL